MDGKLLAAQLMDSLRPRVEALRAKGVQPDLAVILVGDNPASQIYVRNKETVCQELGVLSQTIRLPAQIKQAELEAEIDRLNQDASVHGILVQLPLPAGLQEEAAQNRILPQKDVDGFHPQNAGKLLAGAEGMVPCTAKGILFMLKAFGVPLAGKEAVVIGRSSVVGKPTALLLLEENCTVTICHSKTENLSAVTRRADILVAAVGKPDFVTADMVKPGVAVIDVGINRVNGKVTGDVDFAAVEKIAGWISPVPGGVGKMTIGMLMENTISAAEQKG